MAQLIHQSYGKHSVQVSKIKRAPADPSRHDFVEASIDVELQGDFAASYTAGDNRLIVATDSIRNTVYALAKDDPWDTVETFALALTRHFLETYAHVNHVRVMLREHRWHRIGDHDHAFTGSDGETPTAEVRANREGKFTVTAGLDQLMLAKTTDSGFSGFVDDGYRTLKDTDDRILATILKATWDYTEPDAPGFAFAEHRKVIREALLGAFGDHYSVSVQQTLFLMGTAALKACPLLEQITLTMPNKHHILFNLEPLGCENDNEVFVVTDSPAGYIHATVGR